MGRLGPDAQGSKQSCEKSRLSTSQRPQTWLARPFDTQLPICKDPPVGGQLETRLIIQVHRAILCDPSAVQHSNDAVVAQGTSLHLQTCAPE